MEALVEQLFQTSIVGGAFVYLLFWVTKRYDAMFIEVTKHLEAFGHSLRSISEVLLKIDIRIEQLEERMRRYEDKYGKE